MATTTIDYTMRALLVATSGVTAIVGTTPARIYQLAFPANATFPLLVFRVISGNDVLKSAPADAGEEMTTRFQLDTWAYTYDETQDMKLALHSLFRDYSGTVNSQRILSTNIDLTFAQFEPDTGLYRYTMDVSVTHEGA
jgi:hypothetical protein